MSHWPLIATLCVACLTAVSAIVCNVILMRVVGALLRSQRDYIRRVTAMVNLQAAAYMDMTERREEKPEPREKRTIFLGGPVH